MNILLSTTRNICTTARLCGKRNFRKFFVYGKREPRYRKEAFQNYKSSDIKYYLDRGVRPITQEVNGRHVLIPEMVPEIIVPDLTGFKLKPYVSYRVSDVNQSEFTPLDLFYAVYSKKIISDFKEGKLDDEDEPLNPSKEELLTPEVAWSDVKKTGSDIF